MAEEIVSAQYHHATSQKSYRPLFYIFSSARGRVVIGPGQHRRRRRRDGAVSYEPKLVGNTTAKDKWRGLMKWTDGRRTRWPGFPDAGESSGSLAPPVRESVDYQLRIYVKKGAT